VVRGRWSAVGGRRSAVGGRRSAMMKPNLETHCNTTEIQSSPNLRHQYCISYFFNLLTIPQKQLAQSPITDYRLPITDYRPPTTDHPRNGMHHITTSELSYWCTLSSIPGITATRLKKLFTQCGGIENLIKAGKNSGLKENEIALIQKPNQEILRNTLTWLEQENHFLIPFTDKRYPALLSEIATPPAMLFIQGDITLLSSPQIAMVGSRRPTYTGLELASEFSQGLSRAGWCVTSGLALGIDTACHEGALAANGKTIAILGSGLQHIYPKKNKALAEQLIERGCLISELPLLTPPMAENFPRRNRIISGLSVGTVVVEAALKSGSLITAHYAAEQGRDVFAIPGSIRNPLSSGCLSLIQQGAKCVTHIDDILHEINEIFPNHYQTTLNQTLDCTEQQVLACIEYEITTIDQICDRSKLSAQKVTAALLELEFSAAIKRQQNGYIKVVGER
jgi:DNA processing protein